MRKGTHLIYTSSEIDKAIGAVSSPIYQGAVESLVSIPATMSHASLPEEIRQKMGLTPDLVRISVGLEDFEDLKADISQALNSGL